ncbi:hypothetical protein CTI12_AA082360 [Artemisia annua]|uniref:RRM domain-containing protein n=1 Tax=Artemisia annua TaxID=35608 RepID=A0A2U1Q2I6_ARTAN|nr:hypothetical protein CTI12_AA082360 [Artemisia annua]
MGDRRWYTRQSKEDHTQQISKTIFVTNFPEHFTFRDLWRVCDEYGKVIDVYIPNRKSKAGKPFAFVRYIKVDHVDRLVENLCTVWVGRLRLHANIAWFHRATKTYDYQPKVMNTGNKWEHMHPFLKRVDIEGVPLHAQTTNTLKKIGLKWGDVMDMKDLMDSTLYHKQLCIKMKETSIILEMFKVIVQGNVYWFVQKK